HHPGARLPALRGVDHRPARAGWHHPPAPAGESRRQLPPGPTGVSRGSRRGPALGVIMDAHDTPLKANRFQVLLALSEGPLHGFAIREVVEERTNGGMTLWPATLYGVLRDLAEAGWIAELEGAA